MILYFPTSRFTAEESAAKGAEQPHLQVHAPTRHIFVRDYDFHKILFLLQLFRKDFYATFVSCCTNFVISPNQSSRSYLYCTACLCSFASTRNVFAEITMVAIPLFRHCCNTVHRLTTAAMILPTEALI